MSEPITQEAYDELNNKFTELQTNYDGLNTKHTALTGQFTEASTKLSGYGELTPEAITDMQTRLNAFSEKGDPEELKLNLSKFQRENESLLNSNKDLLSQNESYKNSINSNKISKKIINEAKEQNIDIETYRSTLDFFSDEFSINDNGDILSNGKGRSGINAGLPVSEFLKEAQVKGYKYLAPSSNGGKGVSLDSKQKVNKEERTTAKEYIKQIWK